VLGQPRLGNEPVVVARFGDSISAHAACSRLASEGIEARVVDEHMITMDPLLGYALGGIKVVVSPENAAAAREILGSRAPAEEQETCPRCGSTNLTAHRAGRRSAFLSILLLGLPIGRARAKMRCEDCGHAWRA